MTILAARQTRANLSNDSTSLFHSLSASSSSKSASKKSISSLSVRFFGARFDRKGAFPESSALSRAFGGASIGERTRCLRTRRSTSCGKIARGSDFSSSARMKWRSARACSGVTEGSTFCSWWSREGERGKGGFSLEGEAGACFGCRFRS